jgi:outer membrane protein assembly factor BamB
MGPRKLVTVGVALAAAAVAGAADWPQFRGPTGGGVAAEATPPAEWSAESGVAWKVKLPGTGWAQPIVAGESVFVAAAVSDPPLVPKNMMAGVATPQSKPGAKPLDPPGATVDWQLVCLDRATGKARWANTVASGKPKYAVHPSNSYATETPAADAERVYAFFGATGTLAAFDHAGKELWKKEYGAHPTANAFGTGSSPVLAAGKLYLQCFNDDAAFLVCLDAKTGQEKWRADRKPGTSWSTPLVWANAARTEVVACGAGLVTGHDPDTGAELWRCGGIDSTFSSSPAATDRFVFFGNSGPGSRGQLLAVKAGAKGDVTPKAGAGASEFVAWSKLAAGPGLASPVAVGDYLYVCTNSGLACYEAATGKQVYKERLPKVRMIAACPLVADGKLFFVDDAGQAVVVKAGPQFEVVGEGKLDDTFWASPAAAGDALLLRGLEHLYCLRK